MIDLVLDEANDRVIGFKANCSQGSLLIGPGGAYGANTPSGQPTAWSCGVQRVLMFVQRLRSHGLPPPIRF